REYNLATNRDGEQFLDADRETGLGVMRDRPSRAQPLTELGQQQIEKPNPLIITKTNSRSRAYRNAYMDSIAAKKNDTAATAAGEGRVVRQSGPPQQATPPDEVPHARDVAAQVRSDDAFAPAAHAAEALDHELARYPPDEMLQMHPNEILDPMLGI